MDETVFGAPRPPPEPPSLGRLAALDTLILLAALRVQLGLDPDASHAIGDFLGLLGAFGEISRAVDAAPGLPWDPRAAQQRADLAGLVRRAEPIMARLAVLRR